MKKLTQIALAVAAIGAVANASAAPVLTYTVDSNVLTSARGNTAGLDFAKFDASLGTLQSVQVELFSNLKTTVKAENTSTSSTANIIATAGSVLTFSVGSLTQTLTSSNAHTFAMGVFDGAANYTGTSGGSYTFGSLNSNSVGYTDVSLLSLFTGAGNLHASLVGTSSSSVDGISGNTRSLVLPSFDGYAKVTYSYAQPVPEPETYAMLLAGLALVGGIARRRKSA